MSSHRRYFAVYMEIHSCTSLTRSIGARHRSTIYAISYSLVSVVPEEQFNAWSPMPVSAFHPPPVQLSSPTQRLAIQARGFMSALTIARQGLKGRKKQQPKYTEKSRSKFKKNSPHRLCIQFSSSTKSNCIGLPKMYVCSCQPFSVLSPLPAH